MPTTNHTVTLTINGIDYSSSLKRESLYVRHSMGNENSVCDFKITGSSSYQPQGWDAVLVAIDGSNVFGGYIFQHDGEVLGTSGSTQQTVWTVQCKDWTLLLDQVIVEEEAYKEDSDASILDDLFTTYLPGEGFDVSTYVSTLNSDLDISFNGITLREVLNTLADRVEATWYVNPSKQLVWRAASGFSAASFNIDTVAPNNSTTFSPAFGSLRRQIDESGIVNKVIVTGGNVASTTRLQETFAADGVSNTFGPLVNPPHSIWKVDYYINGGRYIRYTTNIGYEPADKLFAEGGSYEIVCNLENRTIRIQHVFDDGIPDNATDVVIDYYYQTPITVTREHTGSQYYYGRTFIQRINNDDLDSYDAAVEYADNLLSEQAFGRETLTFDVFESGLQPGTKIKVYAPSLSLGTVVSQADLVLEYDLTDGLLSTKDALLWENNDDGVVENYLGTVNYVIQQVQYHPVLTSSGNYLIACKVSAGDWEHTLIDALQQISSSSPNGQGLAAGSGRSNGNTTNRVGRLSSLTNDLGDIAAGRAIFTDGGSASFDWSNYNYHTGAVVGLEDSGTVTPYGVVYILDSGTVKMKAGRMVGMPTVGTVTPSGWGIYTTNGYFSGVVAASEIYGGTIVGNLIQGGTVTGGLISGGTVTGALVSGGTVSGALLTGGTIIASLGTIGGFTVAATQLWSNGGTISTGSVVNSNNPGVYLGTAGLFGYGTLGLTFALYTDPAKSPWISSGTINNVVYEVYETAIMRTSPDVFGADGGVQIDNSGIFGVDPTTGASGLLVENGNNLDTEDSRDIYFTGIKFMLDATTGYLWAEQGFFQGTVYAQAGQFTGTVSASTLTGNTISGGTITGGQISGGTITSATLDSGIITASSIMGGNILGGTVTGTYFTAGTINGGTILASTFTGGSFTGNLFSGGTITGMLIQAGTVTGNLIQGGTLSGGYISGGNIAGGTVSGAVFTSGTVTAGTITAARITGGTVSGALVSGGTVTGALVSGGTVSAAGGSITLGDGYGIKINSSAGFVSPGEIQWIVGGSTTATFSGVQTSGILQNNVELRSKGWGTVNSWLFLSAERSSGTAYQAWLWPSYDGNNVYYGKSGAGTAYLDIYHGGVEFKGSALHPLNNNTSTLGNTTVAWKYIYMASPDNTVWRLSVSNAGALVIT